MDYSRSIDMICSIPSIFHILSHHILFLFFHLKIQFKSVAIVALTAASASAFAPSKFGARTVTSLNQAFQYGKYDEKLWDNDAKKEVYEAWDPNAPRTVDNFNPFETLEGNSPDASGMYPGEMRYKDPMRGDVSFAKMMEERTEAEERAANPKAGDVPGCPGCKN